jgi:large subunit ribosomal protein L3
MPFIVGKKVKMEQIWDEQGNVIPVTVISAGPVVVTQVKSKEKDGYEAFQVGYDNSAKHISKPLSGHLSVQDGSAPGGKKLLGKFRHIKEFRKTGDESFSVGDTIDVSAFAKGDRVNVTGWEKGRGFQGVVKRHGFHGGPKTHGQKNRLRAPGSIGPTAPQRVMKGKKMAGRMGNERVTLKKVLVVDIDKENNILTIKGPVPGNSRNILLIQK